MRVSNTQDLARALGAVQSGQVIEVDPGEYLIDRRLVTGHAGTERRPIVLRAAKPGTVVFSVKSVEAIVVTQPYWLFENLTLRGDCARHGECEHAFHVVGKARGTVLRNNRIEDFNAHVKVNGEGGFFPDDGLLQFSTLMNGSARLTDRCHARGHRRGQWLARRGQPDRRLHQGGWRPGVLWPVHEGRRQRRPHRPQPGDLLDQRRFAAGRPGRHLASVAAARRWRTAAMRSAHTSIRRASWSTTSSPIATISASTRSRRCRHRGA